MTDRIVRNGQVAVLVSPGFGAGWSTWNREHADRLVFDPKVVKWVEEGKVGDVPLDDYKDEDGDVTIYVGEAASQLVVEWVPLGEEFIIDEYDGNESLKLKRDIPFHRA